MRTFGGAVIVTGLITAGIMAQAPPVDVEKLGPQVGEAAPDFSAVDQFGRQQTLKSIMGSNGAMLSFNRSADW